MRISITLRAFYESRTALSIGFAACDFELTIRSYGSLQYAVITRSI